MTDESAFQSALDELAVLLWPVPAVSHHSAEQMAHFAGICAVFADWLEDHGDGRAVGYRWLSRHGKLPRRGINTWDWWRFGDRAECTAEDLPSAIWDRLPGKPYPRIPDCKEYPAFRDAVSAICKAINSLEADR